MKTYYVGNMPVSDELYHYGRKGMKWGKNLFEDVGGAIGNAAKKVGSAVGGAASNVGKAASSTAKTVKSSVSSGVKAVNNILNNERTGANLRSKLGDAKRGLGGSDLGNIVENSYRQKYGPQAYKEYAENNIKSYQNYQNALNDYRDYSNNPVNTVARQLNMPQNKGNWAYAVPGNEQYLEKFDQNWIPKTHDVGEWFTGSNYKNAADQREAFAKDWEQLREENEDLREKGFGRHLDELTDNAREDREYKDALMNLYNNAPRQRIVSTAKDVGNFASKTAKDVGSWGSKQVDNGKKLFKKLFG